MPMTVVFRYQNQEIRAIRDERGSWQNHFYRGYYHALLSDGHGPSEMIGVIENGRIVHRGTGRPEDELVLMVQLAEEQGCS